MTTESTLAIEATGLVKSFGDTLAVDGVDLAVRRGSVYGVLGPNGAGKTTTIRMLATLLRPDAGSAKVLGYDIVDEADEVRRAVSLTGQLASVDEDLTGRENLILLGRLLGLKRPAAKDRATELLEAFGIQEAAGRLVKTYSGGMRRRLDIAASIVVTPELMFLDEPTTGLDPRSRNQVWGIIRALVAEGTTILLCTQYLEEADQLGRRDRGDRPRQGHRRGHAGPAQGVGRLRRPAGAAARPRPATGGGTGARAGAGRGDARTRPRAPCPRPAPTPGRAALAVAELTRSGVRIADFSLGQPSLDEVFLALTGHPAEDDADEVQRRSSRSRAHERQAHDPGRRHDRRPTKPPSDGRSRRPPGRPRPAPCRPPSPSAGGACSRSSTSPSSCSTSPSPR